MSEKILEKIINNTKRQIEFDKARISESVLKRSLSYVSYEPIDIFNLLNKTGIHIIAEYKRKSPSLGKISDGTLSDVIKDYEIGGAAAISVLTNAAFDGKIADMEEARQLTELPILRKEFIIDEYQIYQARTYGADFVLLITRILSDKQLNDFLDLTDSLGISALVEVESLNDLNRTLKTGASIIGVNNRDLKSFVIDKKRGIKIAEIVPSDREIVIESGIAARTDLDPFIDAGFHNFLIGSSLMKSQNRIDTLNNLILKTNYSN